MFEGGRDGGRDGGRQGGNRERKVMLTSPQAASLWAKVVDQCRNEMILPLQCTEHFHSP